MGFSFAVSLGRSVLLGMSCAVVPSLVTANDDDGLGPPPFVRATGALELGDLGEAERLTVPLTEGAAVQPEALALLGQIRLRQGRASEAAALFERVLAERPGSAPTHARLAEALWEQSKDAAGGAQAAHLRRAGAEFAAAHRLDGNLIDAHMGLVRLYFAAPAEAPEGAVERHAEAASRIDPWDSTYEIADLAEKHARLDLAERYYGRIADKIPENPWLRFKQAAMRAQLGRTAEARATLEAILQKVPGFGPAVELLNNLPAQ